MTNGRFWRIGSANELENDSSRDLINPKFDPVLRKVVEVYKSTLDDVLDSVYLTGSVSRGVERNSSDIDFFAVLKEGRTLSQKHEDALPNQKPLKKAFSWINKFDLEVWNHDWVYTQKNKFSVFAFVIQVHSVLLFGSDLSLSLPKFKLCPDIAKDDIIQIRPDIDEAILEIRREPCRENVKYWAVRVSKNIIRTCFGLVMMEEGKFTRDIELCADTFIKRYPTLTKDIKLILNQIVRPTGDSTEIQKLLSDTSHWLFPMTDAYLERYLSVS